LSHHTVQVGPNHIAVYCHTMFTYGLLVLITLKESQDFFVATGEVVKLFSFTSQRGCALYRRVFQKAFVSFTNSRLVHSVHEHITNFTYGRVVREQADYLQLA